MKGSASSKFLAKGTKKVKSEQFNIDDQTRQEMAEALKKEEEKRRLKQ